MKGNYAKVLFITGFSDSMTHGELVTRFEEYGRITSTRQSEPRPDVFPFAFIEYAISMDATTARSKLHHSVVHGQKLEVHFDTKIPPQFHSMLNDATEAMGPDSWRPTSGGMRNAGSDSLAFTSPASADFRLGAAPERQLYTPRYASGGPMRSPGAHYESRRYSDQADSMRTPVRGRYNDAPGGPGQNRYPDERAGSARDRYIPRNPGGFRPQTRDYGARAPRGGHGDFGGYNNRPQFNRGSYADRDSRGFDDYNSGSYQGRHAAGDRHPPPGRFKSHGSYRDDGYRESQSASGRGSWGDGANANNDGTQLNTPRKSRSRSPSPEREYGTWQRSPIPANENPIDDALESKATENPADGGIGFNEDVLFEAP